MTGYAMNIETIQTFLTLADNQSFTKTAEILFCTQAAVSMRIQRLEENLECRLFVRHKKTANLTKEGELFFPYAQQIQNSYYNAKEHILQSKLMEESNIAITSSNTPGIYIIPSILLKFQQKYPFISVVNHVQYTKNVIDSILNKNYTIGFISQPYLCESSEIICESILDDPLVIIVNHSHPWAVRKQIFLRELKNEVLLISNPNSSIISYLEQTGNLKFSPKNIFAVGSLEGIKQSLYNNMGIAILSLSAVKKELDLNLLCKIELIEDVQLMRHIYLIKRKDTLTSLSAELFIKFTKESLHSRE